VKAMTENMALNVTLSPQAGIALVVVECGTELLAAQR
jgi:hypothetical protein